MRSTSVLPLSIFSGALLFIVSLLTGCDSESSPKVIPGENPPPLSEGKLLTIGSPAPSLDIEHWLSDGHGKFPHVTKFENGKVYVVEFWATWCGPCIGSMPHLVEKQEAFAGQGVQIISVSDEDLSTVNDFLSMAYQSEEDNGPATYGELTSAYCLTTDPDKSVYRDYMRAARQNGIPTAFIVGKSGLVEWIGHPMGMDDVLNQIVANEWDREQFARSLVEEQAVEKLMRQAMKLVQQGKMDEAKELLSAGKTNLGETAAAQVKQFGAMLVLRPIETLIQAGKIDDAIIEIEKVRETADGPTREMLDTSLVALLVQQKQYDKAVVTLNNAQNDLSPDSLNQIAWEIYEHASQSNDVPAGLQDAAIAASEKALDETPDDGSILDTLAHLVYLKGDLDRAIELQARAMENPGRGEAEISAFLKQLREEKEKVGDEEKGGDEEVVEEEPEEEEEELDSVSPTESNE